ncbi:MAG: hypothetical protein M3440_07415, partial [Chloroflexota bacterium]|nr:hypothetical protein [Chloroflexota bacterium]
MDTTFVVIIVIVVLALFGAVAYLFIRETGMQQAKLWFISSQTLRKTFGGGGNGAAGAADDDEPGDASLTRRIEAPARRADASAAAIGTRSPALALDDAALRDLREELQEELRRAGGVTREFDARLTRIEATSTELPQVSEQLRREVDGKDAERRREIERVKNDLNRMRQDAGPRGQRRGEAVADLYGHLARVEASLAGVVNPMLLPGESLTIPDEFFPDTLNWDNWSDVGERAYAFGNAFNQNRFVLDVATADEIERFIGTLRQGLTGAVYPNLRSPNPTPAQLAQMRSGVTSIVDALPRVRRTLEGVYRGDSAVDDRTDEIP